jgi:16S rRNA (cytidine1402-2'-O)-methyltransferase
VLDDVDVIAAEDTRTAKVLLNHYGIKTRLLSYNEHNHARRFPDILAYLDNGNDAALVSDAGTPAISDPGVALVAAVREAGHEVVAVPGPSAVIAALSIAGLPTTSFTFAGFLPRTEGKLRSLLASMNEATLVVYESPERLAKSLAVIADTLPDRRLAVCRELTKRFEEVFVGTASEALAHFQEPRGEIVILIEGESTAATTDLDAAAAEAAQMRELGLSRQQATALLTSRHGIGRREAYELWLQSEKT